MTSLSSESSVLGELRSQFERDMDIKSKLDTKGQSMITMSGTVTALFTGFGTYLLNTVVSTNIFFIPALIFLLGEVITTTFTVYFSTKSYRLKEYEYPMGHEVFLLESSHRDREKAEWDNDELIRYKKMNQEEFEDKMIRSYVRCMEHNKKINDKKAENIEKSQTAFLLSIIIIPLFVLMIALAKL